MDTHCCLFSPLTELPLLSEGHSDDVDDVESSSSTEVIESFDMDLTNGDPDKVVSLPILPISISVSSGGVRSIPQECGLDDDTGLPRNRRGAMPGIGR